MEYEKPGDSSFDVTIKGGAKRMVETLVQCYPAKLTKSQLASLSKMKKTGGSFSTYMSRLRGANLLEESGDLFWASERALQWLGSQVDQPQTNYDVLEMWVRAIPGKKCEEMIRILHGEHPEGVDRTELAEMIGMSAAGGSFSTYLSRLRSNGLLTGSDTLYAGEELMREP